MLVHYRDPSCHASCCMERKPEGGKRKRKRNAAHNAVMHTTKSGASAFVMSASLSTGRGKIIIMTRPRAAHHEIDSRVEAQRAATAPPPPSPTDTQPRAPARFPGVFELHERAGAHACRQTNWSVAAAQASRGPRVWCCRRRPRLTRTRSAAATFDSSTAACPAITRTP